MIRRRRKKGGDHGPTDRREKAWSGVVRKLKLSSNVAFGINLLRCAVFGDGQGTDARKGEVPECHSCASVQISVILHPFSVRPGLGPAEPRAGGRGRGALAGVDR
jgi:hypothetical protein